ncbi:MAG: organic solvent tolerance ABC transporter substrate-binding protein [Nitrospira sp.]|nr:MAG: organic solvent tolerance ABC transporter substrate-binding protein [Nitrospira sp.]
MSLAVPEETRSLPWRYGHQRSGSGWAHPHFRPAGLTAILDRLWEAVRTAVVFDTFLAVLVCSVAFGALPQDSESPTEVVRATVTEVLRILKDPALKDPAKLMPRRRMLEVVIATRFDYAEMSKRALAAYWTPLTNEQRAEFVNLFKAFLSDRYAGKIEGYSGEQVVYLGERLEGQFAEVRTKLLSGKVEIPMDYRLMNQAGRWYAYDIIADGVSLVKNYRSQFEKIIRSDSYEELVQRLRDRTVVEEKKAKQ